MSTHMSILAFYKFQPLPAERVAQLREELYAFGQKNEMRGLVLLAEEGINGTVCALPAVIEQWKKIITAEYGEMIMNESTANEHVFPRWFVKIRPEIVSLKQPDVKPSGKNNHLSPAEFDRMIQEEDVVLLDARNDYETEIGKFKDAIDPKLKSFYQFPEYVKKAHLPRDKKILMYCTGGIRCDKALIEMKKQGYEHVYQLEGGILSYIKEFPERHFEGECFVFDHRVAVDQKLQPSNRYALCPHCGDPGDEQICCEKCSKEARVCVRCAAEPAGKACSKDCRNKLRLKMSVAL